MPGILLQHNRRRGMALTLGLKEPEMPEWNKLCKAQIALSNRRMMPVPSAVHTCDLVFLKASRSEARGAL